MANKAKDENVTELRKRFDVVTYCGFTEYARRNKITEERLGRALACNVKVFTYPIMEVYKQLKVDGIYEDEFFPWEEEYREASEKSA